MEQANDEDEDGTIVREQEDKGTHGIFLLELNEFVSHYSAFSVG